MKAPGRLCKMDGLAVLEIYYNYFYYFKSLCTATFCSQPDHLKNSHCVFHDLICVFRYVLPTHMMIKISEELPK